MEQKDYSLEIVNLLLKEKLHVRALAKKLNTNHMTISRKIKILLEENVVDFKEQGKNNIYFLKNNSEAKSFVFIAENYKLKQLLKKHPPLRQIIEKIQVNNKIKLAIIFGSYAKGLAKKTSDVDVYIETQNLGLKKELEMKDSMLSIKIGKYNKSSLLIKEIEKNHVIIKGVEKFYEKSGFFENNN
jgi:predicted nucleotidyltransferase